MPTAPNISLTSEAWIHAILGEIAQDARLDDDFSETIAAGEQTHLDDFVIPTATDQALAYLTNYSPSKLATSHWVFYHTTVLAIALLFRRRAEGLPESVQSMLEDTTNQLMMVKRGQMNVPRIARRSNNYPKWSNVEYDPRYPLRKLRVQRPISDKSPTSRRQFPSRWSDRTYEIY